MRYYHGMSIRYFSTIFRNGNNISIEKHGIVIKIFFFITGKKREKNRFDIVKPTCQKDFSRLFSG